MSIVSLDPLTSLSPISSVLEPGAKIMIEYHKVQSSPSEYDSTCAFNEAERRYRRSSDSECLLLYGGSREAKSLFPNASPPALYSDISIFATQSTVTDAGAPKNAKFHKQIRATVSMTHRISLAVGHGKPCFMAFISGICPFAHLDSSPPHLPPATTVSYNV